MVLEGGMLSPDAFQAILECNPFDALRCVFVCSLASRDWHGIVTCALDWANSKDTANTLGIMAVVRMVTKHPMPGTQVSYGLWNVDTG